jgi:hypothetical protein
MKVEERGNKMTTIQKTIKIKRNRNITLHLPKKVRPGSHKVTILIEDEIQKPRKRTEPPQFKTYKWNNWPSDSTFRREEIYGDEGR